MAHRLTFEEYQATQARVDKINQRAERRGFTGRITLDVEQVTVTEKLPTGFECDTVWWEVTIGGEAPRYGDWVLDAVLTWDAEAGLITRTAPGVDSVDRSNLREGWCDHCRVNRERTDTYLVRHAVTGETRQVGSTCIKDFLGWQVAPSFLSTQDVESELSGGWGNGERRWTPDTIIAVAWAVVQAFGYVKSNDWSGIPTKDTVADVLDPFNPATRKLAADLAPFVAQAAGQAQVIREWILSGGAGDGEYGRNLAALARAASVGSRNLGILVSAVASWARAMDREIRAQQERDELVNASWGQPKDKITVSVVIKSITPIETMYGTNNLYRLISQGLDGDTVPAGYVFKWFTKSAILGSDTDGTVYTLAATVKGPDEYRGTHSTVILRPKVISTRMPERV